jgi:heat shock protein HslJ
MRLPIALSLTVTAALLVAACSASTDSGATPPTGTSPGPTGIPTTLGTSPGPTSVGGTHTGSPVPDEALPAGLEGRTFLSRTIDGRVLVVGSRVRLSFANGRAVANGGCNTMSGPYTIVAGRLAVRDMATTEMACDPALMAQDTWLADLLGGAEITLAGDTLTLARGGVRLTLLDRTVADPDRPLVGTRWVVEGIVTGEVVSSVPQGVTASLTFGDGGVAVETGCNTGGGAVSVAAGILSFGPVSLTEMACGPEAMALEQAVVGALTGHVAYAIEADSLTLDAGGAGLVLKASP